MRRGVRRTAPGDRGLSLLELVIAVAILSIGTLAALRATDQSRIALAGAPVRLLAQVVAQNRAEELRLLAPGVAGALPGRVSMGGRDFTLEVITETTAAGLRRVRISARGDTGEGALLIAVLPPGSVR